MGEKTVPVTSERHYCTLSLKSELEFLGHPRVVHLVELLELVGMIKLDVESHPSRARSLPVTVWALIPLHLYCQMDIPVVLYLLTY